MDPRLRDVGPATRGGAAVIAAWRTCVEPGCGVRFGLTPRQCSPAMRPTERCAEHRPIQRRRTKAAWMRQIRSLAVCGPNSAPIRALDATETLRSEREAA